MAELVSRARSRKLHEVCDENPRLVSRAQNENEFAQKGLSRDASCTPALVYCASSKKKYGVFDHNPRLVSRAENENEFAQNGRSRGASCAAKCGTSKHRVGPERRSAVFGAESSRLEKKPQAGFASKKRQQVQKPLAAEKKKEKNLAGQRNPALVSRARSL